MDFRSQTWNPENFMPWKFLAFKYNKFTSEVLDTKMKEKGLVDKSDISGFIDSSGLDKKLATLATKADLKAEQDKIVKLQVFDSSYFCGKIHFEDDGTENYLVFPPVSKRLLIAIIFQRENLKNYPIKVLNLVLHLIIV